MFWNGFGHGDSPACMTQRLSWVRRFCFGLRYRVMTCSSPSAARSHTSDRRARISANIGTTRTPPSAWCSVFEDRTISRESSQSTSAHVSDRASLGTRSPAERARATISRNCGHGIVSSNRSISARGTITRRDWLPTTAGPRMCPNGFDGVRPRRTAALKNSRAYRVYSLAVARARPRSNSARTRSASVGVTRSTGVAGSMDRNNHRAACRCTVIVDGLSSADRSFR